VLGRLVDLTQPLGPATMLWPGSRAFEATVLGRHETEGSYWREVALPEHAGTHLDAPVHFGPGRETVDELPLERLVVPAVCVDLQPHCRTDPDFALSRTLLEEIERDLGGVEAGCAVLFRTGWDAYVDDAERYARFPGIGPHAAELLVERAVAGVGIDTLGIDPAAATSFPAHRITQPAGVWHLEGLIGLERVPPRGAWLVAGAIPLVEGSGAPARAFAIVPTDAGER
jgi:kynurenine formamidase